MRELFTGPAAGTTALWALILNQEKLDEEHFDKLGRHVDVKTLADNMWFAMTAELAKVFSSER